MMMKHMPIPRHSMHRIASMPNFAGNRQADERNGDVCGLLRLGAVASRFADQTQPATWCQVP